MTEATISLADPERILSLFGPRDQHLRAIRETLGVSIHHRDGEIRVAGDEAAVNRATQALEHLNSHLDSEGEIAGEHVAEVLARVQGKPAVAATPVDVASVARKVIPRT